MKPLHVLILALLVATGGLAVWYNSNPADTASAGEQKLFPALADQLDAVSQVTMQNASGTTVEIERKNGDWLLAQKPRYYVDSSKLGQLLVTASEAVAVEQKTANPELYSRLGLRDISDAESDAVLLTITASGQTFDVLVGNRSDRFGGSTFVRKPGEAASYQVSPQLDAKVDYDDWLDKQVVDIAADEVQSVVITTPDGEITEIRKDAMFNADFDLVGREEQQVLNDAGVRGVARGLTGLSFDEVIRGAAFAINSFERTTVTYTLFSGVVIDVTLFFRDAPEEQPDADTGPPAKAQYWVNLGARFDESIAQQFVPQPGTVEEGEESEKRLELTPADLADRRQQVERINKTRSRWIYKITESRFDSMNQSAEDLIVSSD